MKRTLRFGVAPNSSITHLALTVAETLAAQI